MISPSAPSGCGAGARPDPMESRLKTLCKLLLLAVLALAVVGAMKDWYTLRTGRSENGQRQITLELNDAKMKSDLAVVKASSREAIDGALEDEHAKSNGVVGTTGPAGGTGARKPDAKVRELESKRRELASQLEHLKKVPGAKFDAALDVIQQRIDEYDRAIEKEQSGH
jgi:hypothetical protein